MIDKRIKSYSEFKQLIADNDLKHFYEIKHNVYNLFAVDKNLKYLHMLKRSDEDDYISTLKDLANIPKADIQEPSAFASKKDISGKFLYKRVHGVSTNIPANTMGMIPFILPYDVAKFSGAEIFGTTLLDSVDFKVLDTGTNTYSGLDVGEFGANFMLNQFGFNVKMPNDRYKNTSNYDASLFAGMILCCEYTNNTDAAVDIAVNFELHEVK